MKATIAVTMMSIGAKPSSFSKEADLPATVQVGIHPHGGLPGFIAITIEEDGSLTVKQLQVAVPAVPTAAPPATDRVPADLQAGRGRKKKKAKARRR